MGEFFGTDGIRGVAGQFPLDAPTVERIGYSLASELRALHGRAPQLVIGRDTRESGDWIEAAIGRGIAAAGGSVRAAGVITTPGVAYLTRVLNADAGVVISASHNPYQDNGIKVFAPTGRKLDDATEQAIERDLKADAASFPVMPLAIIETEPQLREQYLAFLREEFGASVALHGMKLVVDCANGASSELAPRLFTALGAEVLAINAEPNGRNINLACGSLHPETLQARVKEAGAALGLAFDGDADRLLLVDEHGQLVDGDQMLFIVAEYLHAQDKLAGNRVVATVMSNLGLEVALRARGIELVRTSVGDKYVLEELLTNGGSLGGEQSGHLIFPELSLAGDGMLSALEVLRVIQATGKSLGTLAGGFTRFPQKTINVRVTSKPKLDTVPSIKAAMDAVNQALGDNGRLLVRYSGTENLVRVMVEAADADVVQRHAEAVAAVIQTEIG
ncbi:MAG: phosphoglucosamine mutase [Acidobacteria bacterium]|nr:phosphoglucosamine mutase [Acidobacteriota bacterium]MBI3422015.1 phosphoglucosamine mutase [Acidobacteriota bacterium]